MGFDAVASAVLVLQAMLHILWWEAIYSWGCLHHGTAGYDGCREMYNCSCQKVFFPFWVYSLTIELGLQFDHRIVLHTHDRLRQQLRDLWRHQNLTLCQKGNTHISWIGLLKMSTKQKSWTSVSNIAVTFLNMFATMYQSDMPKV